MGEKGGEILDNQELVYEEYRARLSKSPVFRTEVDFAREEVISDEVSAANDAGWIAAVLSFFSGALLICAMGHSGLFSALLLLGFAACGGGAAYVLSVRTKRRGLQMYYRYRHRQIVSHWVRRDQKHRQDQLFDDMLERLKRSDPTYVFGFRRRKTELDALGDFEQRLMDDPELR